MDIIRGLLLLFSFSAVVTTATADSAAPVDGYQDEAPTHHLIWSPAECESDNPDALISSLPVSCERSGGTDVLPCCSAFSQESIKANPTRAPPVYF